MQHTITSINTHRLPSNPAERIFLEEWGTMEGSTLRFILEEGRDRKNLGEANVSDRDRQVAATVMQWLGSPCGQFYLSQVQIRLLSLDNSLNKLDTDFGHSEG